MTHALLEQLEEIFEKPESFQGDNVRVTLNLLLKHLITLQTLLNSDSLDSQKEGMKITIYLRKKFDEHRKMLCDAMHLPPELFESLMAQAPVLSNEDEVEMNRLFDDLQAMQPEEPVLSEKRVPISSKKNWVKT